MGILLNFNKFTVWGSFFEKVAEEVWQQWNILQRLQKFNIIAKLYLIALDHFSRGVHGHGGVELSQADQVELRHILDSLDRNLAFQNPGDLGQIV